MGRGRKTKAEVEDLRISITNMIENHQNDVKDLQYLTEKVLQFRDINFASKLGAAILGIEVAVDNLQAAMDSLGDLG